VSQSSRRWGNAAVAEGTWRGWCSGLGQEGNGVGMGAVRWGRAHRPFIGGRGGVEAFERGGDQPAAAVMAINGHPVQWGVKKGRRVRCYFQERRECWGGACAH
jgi:hypothetical protein